MTAQPSSQAEREDVAREVLARVADERAGVHIHPVHYIAKRIAATYGYQPSMSGDQRDRLNSRQRRDVQELAEELYAAMLAFSDREHATPRSMPEEVVEARTALVEYAMHYGPRCRECANHGDICPMSGMACGERRKATEFVVDALIYGAAHGYCPSALIPGASA